MSKKKEIKDLKDLCKTNNLIFKNLLDSLEMVYREYKKLKKRVDKRHE